MGASVKPERAEPGMSSRDKLKDAVTTDDAEAADEARRKADEAAAKLCLPSATVEKKAQADEGPTAGRVRGQRPPRRRRRRQTARPAQRTSGGPGGSGPPLSRGYLMSAGRNFSPVTTFF